MRILCILGEKMRKINENLRQDLRQKYETAKA